MRCLRWPLVLALRCFNCDVRRWPSYALFALVLAGCDATILLFVASVLDAASLV